MYEWNNNNNNVKMVLKKQVKSVCGVVSSGSRRGPVEDHFEHVTVHIAFITVWRLLV